VRGIDELRNRWRSLKVRDPLSLHDILDGVRVLDEGDDTHLRLAPTGELSEKLQRIELPPSPRLRGTGVSSSVLGGIGDDVILD
jgi:hypothetical protein